MSGLLRRLFVDGFLIILSWQEGLMIEEER